MPILKCKWISSIVKIISERKCHACPSDLLLSQLKNTTALMSKNLFGFNISDINWLIRKQSSDPVLQSEFLNQLLILNQYSYHTNSKNERISLTCARLLIWKTSPQSRHSPALNWLDQLSESHHPERLTSACEFNSGPWHFVLFKLRCKRLDQTLVRRLGQPKFKFASLSKQTYIYIYKQ